VQSVAGGVGEQLGLELPPTLSHKEWEDLGRNITVSEAKSRWCLADWLNYGEDHYEGEGRYTAGMRITGLEYGSLRNVAYVADRFPLSRRRDTLSFGHHQEVASIADEEAQDHLLSAAEVEGLSVKALRERVTELKGGKPADDEYVRVTVRIHRGMNERLEQLAAEDELPVADWIWRCVDAEISSRTELAA
jgi:hypothetical protein